MINKVVSYTPVNLDTFINNVKSLELGKKKGVKRFYPPNSLSFSVARVPTDRDDLPDLTSGRSNQLSHPKIKKDVHLLKRPSFVARAGDDPATS